MLGYEGTSLSEWPGRVQVGSALFRGPQQASEPERCPCHVVEFTSDGAVVSRPVTALALPHWHHGIGTGPGMHWHAAAPAGSRPAGTCQCIASASLSASGTGSQSSDADCSRLSLLVTLGTLVFKLTTHTRMQFKLYSSMSYASSPVALAT